MMRPEISDKGIPGWYFIENNDSELISVGDFFLIRKKPFLENPRSPYEQREITLTNEGSVGFEFAVDPTTSESTQGIIPGKTYLVPRNGFVPAHSSVTFSISFLPGVPETFLQEFWIKVSHFQVFFKLQKSFSPNRKLYILYVHSWKRMEIFWDFWFISFSENSHYFCGE